MIFNKEPGKLAVNEELGALIIGDPDWVVLPQELGGGTRRVLETVTMKCFHCDRTVKYLVLEGGLYVCECDQVYWFQVAK
jgi:hypothetical protein